MINTGLDNLKLNKSKIDGNIALLCHSASISKDFIISVEIVKNLFGDRLKKIFGPQHGFVTDVQDNMVETKNYIHPYYKLPVYSLYSETRAPTTEMLEGINTFIIDLQDVGTRVYTYISTLFLTIKECEKKGIKVVVLDRPNPVGGEITEGTITEPDFESFVGIAAIPHRHGLTMGEIALLFQKQYFPKVELDIVKMDGWERSMNWNKTGRPWINPSPNLSTPDSAYTFVATVLFEGTKLSEARGTTRALEMIGHPKLNVFEYMEILNSEIKRLNLIGFTLRPANFFPMFQKHATKPCQGLQIHPMDYIKFRPWKLGQLLIHSLYQFMGDDFQWNKDPYEYEHNKISIDLINGTDSIRKMIEQNEPIEKIFNLEKKLASYNEAKKSFHLY